MRDGESHEAIISDSEGYTADELSEVGHVEEITMSRMRSKRLMNWIRFVRLTVRRVMMMTDKLDKDSEVRELILQRD